LRDQSTSETECGVVYRNYLQKCDLYANHPRLCAIKKESEKNKAFGKRKKLQGLLEVLEHLQQPKDKNNDDFKGIIRFDVAYEIFSGHQTGHVDKTTFRDALLHPEHGLSVYIVDVPISTHCTSKFIILKSQTFDFPNFLDQIQKDKKEEADTSVTNHRLLMGRHELMSIINTMDTEWDKTCAKVLVGANKSIEEIRALGFDPDTMPTSVKRVKSVAEEVENSLEAAKDIWELRNNAKQVKLEQDIADIENLLVYKKNSWSEMRLNDLQETKNVKLQRLNEVKELANPETAASKQKVKQAIKRQATALQETYRLKRRRLCARQERKMDSDDEKFVAKAIEEKATYHGRRHDTVMYTNRRVKSTDLLNIANFKLLQKGKKLIKSATTVWNRSKPRRQRSI
jgi:hypothetical protein